MRKRKRKPVYSAKPSQPEITMDFNANNSATYITKFEKRGGGKLVIRGTISWDEWMKQKHHDLQNT